MLEDITTYIKKCKYIEDGLDEGRWSKEVKLFL
jgi:hypothetical protein